MICGAMSRLMSAGSRAPPPNANTDRRSTVQGTGRLEGREALAATSALAPRSTLSGSAPEGRPGDAVDPPDLTAERNDVGGIVDDLDRGRPIQPADDGR